MCIWVLQTPMPGRRNAETVALTDQDVFRTGSGILSPQQIDEFFREKGSMAPCLPVCASGSSAGFWGPNIATTHPQTILMLEQLNLLMCSGSWLHDQGLILVTGPTGSGKLYPAAMIDWINRNETRHILRLKTG